MVAKKLATCRRLRHQNRPAGEGPNDKPRVTSPGRPVRNHTIGYSTNQSNSLRNRKWATTHHLRAGSIVPDIDWPRFAIVPPDGLVPRVVDNRHKVEGVHTQCAWEFPSFDIDVVFHLVPRYCRNKME
eukprot:scaffold539_cov144-Amphora_coffeaeformis.AAC.2